MSNRLLTAVLGAVLCAWGTLLSYDSVQEYNVLEIGAGPGWALTDWVARAAATGAPLDPQITPSVIKKWGKHSYEIFKEMIAHPQTTSAIIESSPWVAREMVRHMQPYVTRFDIVECNDLFFNNLTGMYSGYEKVHLSKSFFNKKWKPKGRKSFLGQYDVIVATLPFTRLDDEAIEEILERSYQLLKTGGKFMCIYLLWSRTRVKLEATIQDWWFGNSENARQRAEAKLGLLDDWLHDNFDCTSRLVKRNLPPIYVHVGTKKTRRLFLEQVYIG